MIEARLNGETVALDDATSVRSLVIERVGRVEGVAVALDGEVVPRSAWDGTRLRDGHRIEILVAAQGG